MTIRPAIREDVPAMLEIYNEAVLHTTATYDETPQTLEERLSWYDEHLRDSYPIFVAEGPNGDLAGWASLSRFHRKAGYRFTAENTIYIREDFRGKGIGKQLLGELIRAGRSGNLRVIMALIDADNSSSIHLHRTFGFVSVGHLKGVGFKFNRWLDVLYMQLNLVETEGQSGY